MIAGIFSIGALTNVGEYYLVPDYQKIFIYFFIVPNSVLLLSFIFFFKDKPICLLSKKNKRYAWKSLAFIAKINGKIFELNVEDVGQYQQIYKKKYLRNDGKKGSKFSIYDLWRYKSLRNMTIMLIFVDIVFTLQYYTPTLMLDQFNFGIFLNGISI